MPGQASHHPKMPGQASHHPDVGAWPRCQDMAEMPGEMPGKMPGRCQDRHRIIRALALGRADTCPCFPVPVIGQEGDFTAGLPPGRVLAVAPRDRIGRQALLSSSTPDDRQTTPMPCGWKMWRFDWWPDASRNSRSCYGAASDEVDQVSHVEAFGDFPQLLPADREETAE